MSSEMINIQLRQGMVNGSRSSYCYRLTGEDLVSDVPISHLSKFERRCGEVAIRGDRGPEKRLILKTKQLYRGQGWVGGQWREVTCLFNHISYEISVAGIGVFLVKADGQAINFVQKERGVEEDLVFEAVLGPALILALALRGKYCLHASAVTLEAKIAAFVGESGKGKSTLARWIAGQENADWRLIGDDILPVSQSAGHVICLPHFPQLKIAAANQPSYGLPEQLPLNVIYVIRRPNDGAGVTIKRLGLRDSALTLVRHTVASRLFDADLLTRHLDFCVQIASKIPVRELIYPLKVGALPAVMEALRNDLELLADGDGFQA